jgi:hypothetical protein
MYNLADNNVAIYQEIYYQQVNTRGIILSGRLKNQTRSIKKITWAPKKIVRSPD